MLKVSNMSWYVASLLRSQRAKNGTEHAAQQCQYLIEARSHDGAYERALELGTHSATGAPRISSGIVDLLLVHDQLADGAELLWSESEMTAAEIESRILRRDDMRAFREDPSSNGWYIGNIVLCEVHDEGSHGDLSLVWNNSYLIHAQVRKVHMRKLASLAKSNNKSPARIDATEKWRIGNSGAFRM